MFTSVEPPITDLREASPTIDALGDWDDVPSSPRVTHRIALAFILGASLAGYAVIYAIGSLADGFLTTL